jgi:hypothetical protein
MKKQNPITEGMLSKFVDNIFTNIKNNNRARNIKALKTDPQLKKAEEDFANAYDSFMKQAEKRKAKHGF